VVNTVKAAAEKFGGKANFIHVEVYKTFDPLVYADEMREWRLTSEPWTFVIDKQGVITGRLGGPVSLSELTQALTPVLVP
jgi:peroxiredoxin